MTKLTLLTRICLFALATLFTLVQLEAQTPTYISQFGTNGTADGQLSFPSAVLVHPANDNIYVIDKNNERIQVFDSDANYQFKFGSIGIGDGQFSSNAAENFVFDTNNDLWVVDRGNDRIQKFSDDGIFIQAYGSSGTADGQFDNPEGIAINPANGDIWVGDRNNERVQIFTSAFVFKSKFGSEGTGNGQFSSNAAAVDIAFDGAGRVYIADRNNHRIQIFDTDGNYVDQFGTNGTGDGQLANPDAIQINPNGDIWVADRNNERIQIFNSSHVYQTQFGTIGTSNGQFSGNAVVDITFDAVGDAYIVDRNNHRIQKFDGPAVVSAPTSAIIAATVFLEGAYNGTNLNTTLNASIPLTQPYSINGHSGGSAGSVPANAVDWVLVELREAGSAAAALNSTKIGSSAGFLMNDGTIKATDGTSDLTVSLSGNTGADFYIVIYHRNHLPIMSANAISESGGTYTIDFTSNSANTYQTNTALVSLAGGKFGMPAGDIDQDGDIDATDLSTWRTNNGAVFSYSGSGVADFNLDGVINAVDRNGYQQPNSGKSSQIPN
ncbi:MAG: 6-bladed beta-propeller [Cyclobacteriaceae bacterium]